MPMPTHKRLGKGPEIWRFTIYGGELTDMDVTEQLMHSIDRIILVKLIVGQRVVTFLSVYAPQSGLSDEVKDLFFDQLRAVTARIPASEFLIPCGDWNGHVGRAGTGYREVHGGMGYGRLKPDVEGERILEYALAFDLLLGNTCFKKRDSHLITYKSGNIATQTSSFSVDHAQTCHRCKSDPW